MQGQRGIGERPGRRYAAAEYAVFVEFQGASVVHQCEVLPLVQGHRGRSNSERGSTAVPKSGFVGGARQLQDVEVAVGFVPDAQDAVEVGIRRVGGGGVHPRCHGVGVFSDQQPGSIRRCGIVVDLIKMQGILGRLALDCCQRTRNQQERVNSFHKHLAIVSNVAFF